MKLSSALVVLGSTAALAAPSAVRRQTPTNIIENGSFESGATGWTLTGGASIISNSDTKHWRFTATEGSQFAILSWDNANNTGSSISTPVGGFSHTAPQSLSFDWKFLTSSTGRGPPPVECTLKTSLYSGMTVQGWTRRANAGGSGSVQETFDTGTSGGTVTIAFDCVGNAGSVVVKSGVAIDNVKWSGTLA